MRRDKNDNLFAEENTQKMGQLRPETREKKSPEETLHPPLPARPCVEEI